MADLPLLVLRRLFAGPPLPPPLAPTLALGVAAPALVANTYLVVAGGFDVAAWVIVAVTTFGALVQVGLLGRYARAPFAPPTWAFAFAYATTATMTLRVIDHEHLAEGDALRWTVIQKLSTAGNHIIQFQPYDLLPLFKYDRGLIEQVLQNIIHNSINYTPENTVIKIFASHQSEKCIIRVSDNGNGIPER